MDCSRGEKRILDLLAALLCAFLVVQGIRCVRGLSFPPDVDFLRDLAYAQTFLDGRFGSDPMYLGEKLWYNPLVPGLSAGASWLTGQPLHIVYAQLGAYLNVVVPVCFYIMLVVLFGRWIAFAGLAGFLYILPGNEPGWVSATYSPWLYPACFAQGLFYAAIAAIAFMTRKRSLAPYSLVGILIGLTFLAHSAPMLILTPVLLILTIDSIVNRKRGGGREAKVRPVGVLLALGIALVVSYPLLRSILGHYHLRVINTVPSEWDYPPLDPGQVLGLLRSRALTPGGIIAAAGLVGLAVRGRGDRSQGRIVLLWFLVCLAFLLYDQASHTLLPRGIHLPAFVPGFHFLLYAGAAEAVFFGYGFCLAVRLFFRGMERIPVALGARAEGQGRGFRLAEKVVTLAIPLIVSGAMIPGVLARDDFVVQRERSREMENRVDDWRACDWLRVHTGKQDVVLASEETSLEVAAFAGRPVVAVDPSFSNPYVDWSERAIARGLMMAKLRRGEWEAFRTIAARYGVSYVMADRPLPPARDVDLASGLEVAFRSGDVCVYRVLSGSSP